MSEKSKKPLRISGSVAAGQKDGGALLPGTALRILTGAVVPEGADTIVAEEFVQISNGTILIPDPIEKGKNILPQGSDTTAGTLLLAAGQLVTPGRVGLLAAGGCERIQVFQKPQVAIIATGDEILLPGQNLTTGKLYASNLVMLDSWCRHFGMATEIDVVGDHADHLRATSRGTRAADTSQHEACIVRHL